MLRGEIRAMRDTSRLLYGNPEIGHGDPRGEVGKRNSVKSDGRKKWPVICPEQTEATVIGFWNHAINVVAN